MLTTCILLAAGGAGALLLRAVQHPQEAVRVILPLVGQGGSCHILVFHNGFPF